MGQIKTKYILDRGDQEPNTNRPSTKTNDNLNTTYYKVIDKHPENVIKPPYYIQISSYSTIWSHTKNKEYKKKQNKVDNFLDKWNKTRNNNNTQHRLIKQQLHNLANTSPPKLIIKVYSTTQYQDISEMFQV